jgi:hypothetical protein
MREARRRGKCRLQARADWMIPLTDRVFDHTGLTDTASKPVAATTQRSFNKIRHLGLPNVVLQRPGRNVSRLRATSREDSCSLVYRAISSVGETLCPLPSLPLSRRSPSQSGGKVIECVRSAGGIMVTDESVQVAVEEPWFASGAAGEHRAASSASIDARPCVCRRSG